MRGNTRRNLLLSLAAAVVLIGLIIAATSGGGKHSPKAGRLPSAGSAGGDVQLAADYLGISRRELRARLRDGQSMAEVADATRGKSAQGLIADLIAHRQAALSASPASERETLARARAQIVAEAIRARGRAGQAQTAAAYMGISLTALRARLRAGESLAQAAAAVGKSRAGLIDALVSVKAGRLHTALAEHAINRKQEQAALGSLRRRTAQAVDQRATASAG
jgi:DNA-binding protein Fis